MTEYVKLAVGAGNRYLETLVEFQETFLKSVKEFAASMPAAPPVPALPYGAELPTPLEVAETNFAFTEKLIKQQKAFTEKFLTLTTPATTAAGKSSSKR